MCNISAALRFGFAPPLTLLAQVKLGGNKVKGARRMFFCLVHAYGRQTGRTSAPPLLPSPAAPALDESTGAAGAGSACVANSGGDGDATVVPSATPAGRGGGGVEPGSSSSRGDGVAAESSRDQVFRFWDEEANGTLVQAPLDLDRQGRGWCEVSSLPVCSCVRGLRRAFWRATARGSSG